MNNDKIINYLIDKIINSKYQTNPWVHKYINNIFPNELYSDILEHLPTKEHYKTWVDLDKNAKLTNYSPERYMIQFGSTEFKKLDDKIKLFFNNVFNILCSNNLQKAILNVFKDTINHRFSTLGEYEKSKIGVKNYQLTVSGSLVKDFTKYSLGAHTDSFHKLVTFLFYLPKNNQLSNLGTSLFSSKKNICEKDCVKHFNEFETKENFKLEKKCEFLPNSLFIFPRTNYTYHGVSEVNIDNNERNLLQFNYHIMGTN